MPCYHPLPAWRTQAGNVVLGKELADSTPLELPCGGCLGCRTAAAKAWALRCHLELFQHPSATFNTLTYDDENKPPTLQKGHLQRFLRNLRRSTPDRRLRFFASGEYGEKTNRPHYHTILFGLNAERDAALVQDTWRKGHTHTVQATPATIAYTAGYTSKKIGWRHDAAEEQIDYETGELYKWQPPFIQMSRKPGIGGAARDKYTNSWRAYAIHNGTQMKVPRYLHDAWEKKATPEEIEQLAYEQYQKHTNRDNSQYTREAQEKIAIAKQRQQSNNREL